MRLSIQQLIGKGYGKGWFTNCHCRYRVFKGARNTKKSYVIIGLEILFKILDNPIRNILVVRQNATTNRISTFSTICGLIYQPCKNDPSITFKDYFSINKSDMTITYKPTGQQIIFSGFYPDPTKLTSIRPFKGEFTDMYIEEAFQVEDYEDFRKVDGSIRGVLPKGVYHQITLCLNAWDVNHWIYEKFFKGRLEDDYTYLSSHDYQDWCDEDLVIGYGKGLYLHTSTYTINEFRDVEQYDLAMEELKKVSPDIYKVEALGMWGLSGDIAYPEFNESLVLYPQQALSMRFQAVAIGIDTGLSDGDGRLKTDNDRIRSATTMSMIGITADSSSIITLEEYYHSNEKSKVKKTEMEIQTEIIQTLKEWQDKYWSRYDIMSGRVPVYVDSADKGFREGLDLEARKQGLVGFVFIGSAKNIRIRDRVMFIRRLMAYGDYKIVNTCKELIREYRSMKVGEKGKPREDIDDHTINANEYAWIPLVSIIKRWKDFKQTT